jgi:hypothetical protein
MPPFPTPTMHAVGDCQGSILRNTQNPCTIISLPRFLYAACRSLKAANSLSKKNTPAWLFCPRHRSEDKPHRHFRFQIALVTVMIAPAVTISLMLAIPSVIVIEPATIPIPVAVVVPASLPTRSDPRRSAVRRNCPITTVPNVAAIYRIPIAVHPDIARARRNRSHPIRTRRRWSADSNSHGYLSFKGGRASQKHRGQQRCANEFPHVLSS